MGIMAVTRGGGPEKTAAGVDNVSSSRPSGRGLDVNPAVVVWFQRYREVYCQ